MKRIVKAFFYSLAGLAAAFKSEAAFRQDVAIFVAGTAALFFLPFGEPEKIMMFMTLAVILIAELVNTAIEKVTDRIGLQWHELSKAAKDIGSAIVFVSFVLAIVVWLWVFIVNMA